MGIKREVEWTGMRVGGEAEFRFNIHGGTGGEEACCDKGRGESACESIANEIMRTDLANVFALEHVELPAGLEEILELAFPVARHCVPSLFPQLSR